MRWLVFATGRLLVWTIREFSLNGGLVALPPEGVKIESERVGARRKNLKE